MGFIELDGIMHAHDEFSNFNASPRFPYDCGIGIVDQLGSAYRNNLQFIIKTNHNTVRGYKETIDHQRNNPNSPLARIKVFMGEEVSIVNDEGKEGHVLVYGVSGEIKRGLTMGELKDAVRSQGGITVAAHPDAFGPRLGAQAIDCDLIEGHNANNVDMISNALSIETADRHNKFIISGGDVHVSSETGNAVMTVRLPEKDLTDVDVYDVTRALLRGEFTIKRAAPNRFSDIRDHVLYQLSGNRYLIENITEQHGDTAAKIGKYFVGKFLENQDAWFVRPGARELLKAIRNVSRKIAEGYDHRMLYGSRKDQIKSYIMPESVGKRLDRYAVGRSLRSVGGMLSEYHALSMMDDFWREDRSMSAAERLYVQKLNSINERIRSGARRAGSPAAA